MVTVFIPMLRMKDPQVLEAWRIACRRIRNDPVVIHLGVELSFAMGAGLDRGWAFSDRPESVEERAALVQINGLLAGVM